MWILFWVRADGTPWCRVIAYCIISKADSILKLRINWGDRYSMPNCPWCLATLVALYIALAHHQILQIMLPITTGRIQMGCITITKINFLYLVFPIILNQLARNSNVVLYITKVYINRQAILILITEQANSMFQWFNLTKFWVDIGSGNASLPDGTKPLP